MSNFSDHFTDMPPAALVAYEAGKQRMQARLGRITAHASAAPGALAAPGAQPNPQAGLNRERFIRSAYVNASGFGLAINTVDRLLDLGTDPADLGEELVAIFAKTQAKQDTFRMQHSNEGARITHDYEDPATVQEAMADAIAYPAIKALNPAHTLPDNGARKFMGYGAGDFARDLVARSSGRIASERHLTHVVGEALGNTTSDFPNLLGTSANKVLLAAIEAAAPTYRTVFSVQNAANFQPLSLVRAGDYPALLELNEHGEITRGSMSDSAEVARLKSAGRTFGITRQALINDSLGAFTNLAVQAGQSVAAYESLVAWTVFVSNQTLATTSAAVFSTTHGNLTASGTAISATSLGIGRAAMRVQKSLDGVPLNVVPQILAVPAAKETIAEQVLSPLVIPDSASSLTTVGLRSPSLTLVVEPLLDANSLTAWYLLGNPARGSNFVCGRLAGAEAPRIRTASPLNVDGVEFQVLVDFYAAAVDYRFGYKNAGA